ncbi:urease accessory protein UreF [Yoonia sp.]|uniref:urease accessory protein UreF n=1 Tax=Yoonia sp. TaxID=2212373 RepID=UPI0035C7CE87
MPTKAILTLSQWLSPSYPLGSFAFSHGLEAALAAGWVSDAASLKDWLADVLTDGSGWSDAVLLNAAFLAQDRKDLQSVDVTGRAFAASAERLRENVNQGAAFARTVQGTSEMVLPDVVFPVAVGWAAKQSELPRDLTLALYLQAFVSNIVMACVRLMPLGQTAGQQVIQDLAPLCEVTAAKALASVLDDLYSNTFLSDIAAMRHEVQQPRLFQS